MIGFPFAPLKAKTMKHKNNKTTLSPDNRSGNSLSNVSREINAGVSINEKLVRRTRNGGFIAWPQLNTANKENNQKQMCRL